MELMNVYYVDPATGREGHTILPSATKVDGTFEHKGQRWRITRATKSTRHDAVVDLKVRPTTPNEEN